MMSASHRQFDPIVIVPGHLEIDKKFTKTAVNKFVERYYFCSKFRYRTHCISRYNFCFCRRQCIRYRYRFFIWHCSAGDAHCRLLTTKESQMALAVKSCDEGNATMAPFGSKTENFNLEEPEKKT